MKMGSRGCNGLGMMNRYTDGNMPGSPKITPMEKEKFEIGFVDGLKHGSFFFCNPMVFSNLPEPLSVENGRVNLFLTEKEARSFIKELFPGRTRRKPHLYYSLTNAEVFKYFKKIREEGLDLGDIPITENICLEQPFPKVSL